MSEIAHHVLRRALDATNAHYSPEWTLPESVDDQPEFKQIAVWGMVLLWATVILFMAFMSMVSLLATLITQ